MALTEAIKDIIRPYYFRYRSAKADWAGDINREAPVPSEYDSVLIVCIDALRPDYTPDLPLSWDHAIAPAPWTFPSVTSFLSGEYPHEHGAIAQTRLGDETFAMPEQADPEQILSQSFAEAGYETLALYAFPTPFIATQGWFGTHRVWSDEPVGTLVDYYRDWVEDRDRTFAYIHLGDLHAPVDPPANYIRSHDVDTSLPNLTRIEEYADSYDPDDEDCRYYREHSLRLYAAALEYVEDVLEPLLTAVGDDTLVVVTGDHGEAQYEHAVLDRQFHDSWDTYGVGHGGTPFDAVARVPVGSNGFTPPAETVSLVDLPRTVLDAALEQDIDEFGGVSWLDDVASRPVLCEGCRYGIERKAVYLDDKKLIRSAENKTLRARLKGGFEEFDAEFDDKELVAALPSTWVQGDQKEVDRMVADQLTALGYK